MSALDSSNSTSKLAICPNCGSAVKLNWAFCGHCGRQLVISDLSALPSDETPLCYGEPISASDFPDVSGVPGRIVGVRVSHGWAASCGYYDIHEVVDGKAVKTRKVSPARGGGQFPFGWFDAQSAEFDDSRQSRLEVILQNVRYCDIGKKQDGTTVIEPRDARLSMRVVFADAQGSLKYLDVHADVEHGRDEGSCCARDVIREIEAAFGYKKAIDCLLVIHRIGPRLRVVMNGPLYLSTDPTDGSSYSVVDPDSGDVLTIEVNDLSAEGRFFEARIDGLRDGWVSGKATVPIEDGSVARLSPQDFTWEGRRGEAIACDPASQDDDIEEEDWIVAFGKGRYSILQSYIDTAPFLEGYEPFRTPGSYAATTWLEGGGQDQGAWLDRPLPEKAVMLDPVFHLGAQGVGTFREHRDTTMHIISRQTQLEEDRYYFLTEYFNEDGTPTGKYSFDIEAAHDSHYEFTENEVPELRRMMGARADSPLADEMIAFVRRCSGGALADLVWKIRTGSFSY